MRNLIWRLTMFSSRLLTSDENHAVLGDLEERQLAGTPQGLADVLLLAAAQQLRLWSAWRPWIAVISLFPPLGMLVGCAFSVADITSKYPWHNIQPFTPTQLINMSLAASLATAIWSWSVGFGIGWVARRAYSSVLFLLTFAGLLFIDGGTVARGPLGMKLVAALMTALLIAAPLCAGLRKGLIGSPLPPKHALGLTALSIAAFLWCGLQQPGFSADGSEMATNFLFLWPLLLPLTSPLHRTLQRTS